MEAKVEDARKPPWPHLQVHGGVEREANRLIDEAFTKGEFERMVSQLIPADDWDKAREKQLALIGLFETSATIPDEYRYTKWGAFNSVTEYVDWITPTRNTKTQSADERRLSESMFGGGRQLREKAFQFLTSEN